MTCFYVSARHRVCSSRAPSCLHALFCVGSGGVRIPALMSWVSVSCRGSDTRAPCSVSLCERAARVRSAARSLVHVCCVWCCNAVSCFLSAACIHVMSCAVWHAALVFFIGCVLSCCRVLVWTHGLWVFSLAACSCPVLHMAGDLFCWPCACVFCFVWAHGFCLSFSVCHVLSCQLSWPTQSGYLIIGYICSHLLLSRYPPHLLLYNLPCVCSPVPGASSIVSCRVLSCRVRVVSCPCRVLPLPCPALPCPALPCPALPCPALPSLAKPSSCPCFPYRGRFGLFCLFLMQ